MLFFVQLPMLTSHNPSLLSGWLWYIPVGVWFIYTSLLESAHGADPTTSALGLSR